MSRQVHQNKYQNIISYLGLALTESGLHACLDLHPDRRRCRRSRSRHDRHPKLVDVHDVERVTDSSSRTLCYCVIDVISKSTLLSETPSSCRRRTRDSIMTLWTVQLLELWYCKSIKSSWIEIRNWYSFLKLTASNLHSNCFYLIQEESYCQF